ncbi:hypothetical protein CIL05_10275 [Virgibacillus profundi]|uniref:Uncharacterized protein n=1 Tax=Virgibacillus profundi TaxID=2024555 RepID=A0A2A2IF77_9BACI|nr:hypothetical protein CIL05_10275 [Virgibacillus profundi]PXY53915.1 hypothetical protein CIT14_10380 [Virgibacillus profundi]
MSDVMKQVVQEILQGNKKIASNKAVNNSEKSESVPSVKNIKRPNYQRLKKEERLSYTKRNSRAPLKEPKTIGNKRSGSTSPEQFNEKSISALHSMSLVQGNVPKKHHTFTHGNNPKINKARIIGKTKNGGCVWFFPKLPKKLMGSFQRPLNSAAVGVVKMPDCLPSYLLVINEVIQNNQEIKFHLSWNKDAGTPFTAELYDDNVDRLGKLMNDLYQKLNRRSFKQYETYTAVSPSSWLSSQLNISKTVEGIAILEGISYYTSIVLMDSLLKNFETSDFNYEINSNYLLLSGNYHVISKLIAELKTEAARLISSDTDF